MNSNTFASLMNAQEGVYDQRVLFEDFLDTALLGFLRNPKTGKWEMQKELQAILDKYPYKGALLLGMLTALDADIRERQEKNECIDVLGEYYEAHMQRVPFAPWEVCKEMAQGIAPDGDDPVVIFHPSCQTGRVLLAAVEIAGIGNVFYGAESDPICVKIAVLNLWSAGVVFGEITAADISMPDSFRKSFVISRNPPGIVKIERREDSGLWQYLHDSPEWLSTSSQGSNVS